jgi:hypothetical protein
MPLRLRLAPFEAASVFLLLLRTFYDHKLIRILARGEKDQFQVARSREVELSKVRPDPEPTPWLE